MTPEDEQIICGIKKFLQAGAIQHGLDEITDLMRIIDDLRRELHRYQAAAEEEARAVDEQVATSDEHRERCERCEAWELRAKALELECGLVAAFARQAIRIVPMRNEKRKVYQWCATCIENAIANVNEKCPEPQGPIA